MRHLLRPGVFVQVHPHYIHTDPLILIIFSLCLCFNVSSLMVCRQDPSLCVWQEWLESHISCLRRSSRSAIPLWRGNVPYQHQGGVLPHLSSHYINPAVYSIHLKLIEELQYVGRLFSGIDVKISPEMYNSLSGFIDFLLRRWLLHGFFKMTFALLQYEKADKQTENKHSYLA